MAAPDRLPFDPPPLHLDADLRFLLAAAFDASGRPPPRPADPDRARSLARDLDLLPRLACRLPAERLARDLGPAGAVEARDARRAAARSAMSALRTAAQVAEVASRAAIPVVFLKGVALHLAGAVPVAGRSLSDVDVLAPPDRAPSLQAALGAAGFRPRGPSRSAHHLPPLARPGDPAVEVHLRLPGLARPGSGALACTLPDLVAGGGTVPAPALDALRPAPAVAAAHALVHGLIDHGFGPDRYPPLRWIADLCDLGPDPDPGPWIAASEGPAPARAARALATALRTGLPDPAPLLPDEAGTLLAHALAGALDPDYRLALRLRQAAFLARRDGLLPLLQKSLFRLDDLPGGGARPGALLRQAWALLAAEARLRRRSRRDPR